MEETNPADVGSLDGIFAALYTSISGPAGQLRAWDRLRSLFFPGAKLMRVVVSPAGQPAMTPLGLEEFIRIAGASFQTHSFYERELSRRVDVFGHMAHVFSTYESYAQPDGTESLGRGINSAQLWHDGRRWWILNLLWDTERPDNPIPPQYLP